MFKALVAKYHPVAQILHFLSSQQVNEHYLFLSCLCAIDSSIWSDFTLSPMDGPPVPVNSEPFTASVLDQWEVERIIGFLESEDEGIRTLVRDTQVVISRPTNFVRLRQ